VPPEYIDYLLCKTFGWTVTELDEQPRDRILNFLTIIRIEGQFQNIEQQKLEEELKNSNGR
jgi:hypothetical protein